MADISSAIAGHNVSANTPEQQCTVVAQVDARFTGDARDEILSMLGLDVLEMNGHAYPLAVTA